MGQVKTVFDNLKELENLFNEAMWLLGNISSSTWDWSHDRELDITSKEYTVANKLFEEVSKRASALHSKMFEFKYIGVKHDE